MDVRGSKRENAPGARFDTIVPCNASTQLCLARGRQLEALERAVSAFARTATK